MTSTTVTYQLIKATTLDEVLEHLEQIIGVSMQTNDRSGYFASLYYKMTFQVKQGILMGDFEDPKRMEILDVCFANRYLEAYYSWHTTKKAGASWEIAFAATLKGQYILLQHLFMGINAHINFDLGISAVEAVQGTNLSTIRKDFNAINAIIGSLIFEVVNEITRISPLLSFLGLHGTRHDSVLIQFSITNARDGAWAFAEDLMLSTPETKQALIDKRNGEIAELSKSLLNQRGLMKITLWLIHLFEWKNPKNIIQLLHHSKRKFFKIRDGIENDTTKSEK